MKSEQKTKTKPQARRRRRDQLVRLHNPPSEEALVSMWLRLNKWCDYHKIETVRAEGGFDWECQIGYVKSRSPSLLRAIAETHRKVQSIYRHQQKPNPKDHVLRSNNVEPVVGGLNQEYGK